MTLDDLEAELERKCIEFGEAQKKRLDGMDLADRLARAHPYYDNSNVDAPQHPMAPYDPAHRAPKRPALTTFSEYGNVDALVQRDLDRIDRELAGETA